jgi:membrane protein DedA with SNARE-associated domain
MSSADMPVPFGKRLVNSFRSGRALQIGAVAFVVLVVLIVLAVIYGDLPEFVHDQNLGFRLRELTRQYSYAPGFGLLYLEESGVPLPAPGDVFVMYVGIHVPHNLVAWIAAWLGLIVAVVLGATNLFLISRRFGRRLVEHQIAEYVHLTPARLAKAEGWFRRYGVLAIIFGRHIPGFRIPITVAAGIFRVPYVVFAPSVAVSTAIWAGVVLIIGINFGPRLGDLLRAHSFLYFAWGAIVVFLVLSVFIRQRIRAAKAGSLEKPDRPVESPSS